MKMVYQLRYYDDLLGEECSELMDKELAKFS